MTEWRVRCVSDEVCEGIGVNGDTFDIDLDGAYYELQAEHVPDRKTGRFRSGKVKIRILDTNQVVVSLRTKVGKAVFAAWLTTMEEREYYDE